MNIIEAFIQDSINGPGGFKAYARTHPLNNCPDHDIAVASWVIRCLAQIDNPHAGMVIEAIRQERGRRIYASSYHRRKAKVR